MGLRPDVVQAHIAHWEQQLNSGNRPYRRHWPARLFRHEPIENAAKILKDGVLHSRTDAAEAIVRDIAPIDIIRSRHEAHRSVRLYFRPKTPTQYRIEGIRKASEYYQERHAPVLVIFIFKAMDILTRDGVEFSDGNMQSPETNKGSTEEEFGSIPFNHVYHEGSFDPVSSLGAEIIRRRCAEVLLPSPLYLVGTLQAVMCRSTAERTTLLHLLGDAAAQWNPQIRVFSQPGLFENIYAYLDTVDARSEGISFRFHPRRDGRDVITEMWVYDESSELLVHVGPMPLATGNAYAVEHTFTPGRYLTRFEVDGCLAYESPFFIDEQPF